jgi:epsilon-lactone hydrolase
MKFRFYAVALGLVSLPVSSHPVLAWQTTAGTATQKDSSYVDAQGTAHITRVIPLPQTVSPQAQRHLARPISDAPPQETLEQKRAHTDASAAAGAQANRAIYPVNVSSSTIAGVPVKIVTPIGTISVDKQKFVLINVHGGAFITDSGSSTESIPIANLTRTKVVSVLYRLAPEHPFPAAVEDTVSVYRELLKNYQAQNIALYGTSAGAILTAEVRCNSSS